MKIPVSIKFYWCTTNSSLYILSMGAFKWQDWVFATDIT